MAYTFGQLKQDIRAEIFPTGEAINLVKSHNAFFIDAIVDIQSAVDCHQHDNTSIIPHCATFYNCGLTVLDAPRGAIKKVSVIDKIDPVTGLENVASPDDWCSEVAYNEVSYCHMQAYLARSKSCMACLPTALFFGIPVSQCSKGSYPVPTDEGVPVSLPELQLGYHYPQDSTNRSYGRAGAGVWAKERGKIYVAPWIQSTETVVIKWDGIKRTWADADPVDADPKVKKAISLYVQWHHAARHDHDYGDAADLERLYALAIQDLIHDCREETRIRDCEPSHARNATSITQLFYNDVQSYTAVCPDNQTGSPVSVTIPAGTIGSVVSVADANQKAKDEAKRQAESRLDCETEAPAYTNDPRTGFASCTGSEDAPPPEGASVTVTVQAGEVTSTVSKADANQQAEALAQTRAAAQLSCTYWNAVRSFTARCPSGSVGSDVTKTVPAHTFSSIISQDEANTLALNDAKAQAENALSCVGGPGTFVSTAQDASASRSGCRNPSSPTPQVTCTVVVHVRVPPGFATSTVSQEAANQTARDVARQLATARAFQYCMTGQCGVYNLVYPFNQL